MAASHSIRGHLLPHHLGGRWVRSHAAQEPRRLRQWRVAALVSLFKCTNKLYIYKSFCNLLCDCVMWTETLLEYREVLKTWVFINGRLSSRLSAMHLYFWGDFLSKKGSTVVAPRVDWKLCWPLRRVPTVRGYNGESWAATPFWLSIFVRWC